MELAEAARLLAEGGAAAVQERLGLAEGAEWDELQPEERLLLSACWISEGHTGRAERALEGLDGEAATLLRARLFYETKRWDAAREQLEGCDERATPQWRWLSFCVELARLGQRPDWSWDRLDELVAEVTEGEPVEAWLAWPGRAPLEEVLSLRRSFESGNVSGRPAAERLLTLAQRGGDWGEAWAPLRRALWLAGGERLIRHGDREDAEARLERELCKEPPRADDLVTWARFIRRLGASEDAVLAVLRRAYEIWQSSHDHSPVRAMPGVAVELAEAYAAYGFTVEARSLLFGFYDIGARDEAMRDLLRRVLLREAYGYEAEDEVIEGEVPERVEAAPPSMDLDDLSVLFVKAEACYQALGAERGAPVMVAAKALKDALRARDSEAAEREESRLARLVVRLYEDLVEGGARGSAA